ncbi:ISL3 family transposase [Sphingobium yanoikuyae]|uniref:ISL3 family transposase n=1 Tax=Sphingobium yanoikuyae TaxID=13690 RepID=UPI0035C7D220
MSLEGLVTDDLNLPNVQTLRHISSNGQHTYESVSIAPKGVACCLMGAADRRPNGTKRQMFVDTPREGMPAIIHHKRKRWICKACGKTTYEDLDWAEGGRSMTGRMGEWLFKQSIKRSFSAVAADAGIDAGTVTAVFEERAAPAVKAIRLKTPRVLGLDEKHIFGGFRAVMGDVEQRTMFWMLPARTPQALARFFAKIPNREKVEVVVVDMYRGYPALIREWFPDASIVIDKFHITQYATMAMDRARAALRKGMDRPERVKMLRRRWTLLKRRENWQTKHHATFRKIKDQYPELAEIYEWKERACQIWDAENRRDAEMAYMKWLRDLPDRFRTFFKKFTTAMKNWGREIFNYFDHRYTNAYVERLNGMVDDANRIGRGYSYRVLFFKTMLQHGVPKKRPKRLIKTADILDGIDFKRLMTHIYGFGILAMFCEGLWKALTKKFHHRAVPLSTLSDRFRDPSVW